MFLLTHSQSIIVHVYICVLILCFIVNVLLCLHTCVWDKCMSISVCVGTRDSL